MFYSNKTLKCFINKNSYSKYFVKIVWTVFFSMVFYPKFIIKEIEENIF